MKVVLAIRGLFWVGLLAGLAVRGHAAETVDYLSEIKPLFAKHCIACHGPLVQNGKLRLDTRAAMAQGGESGPAVVAGQPDAGLLLGALTGAAGFRMPPEGEGAPLSETQIALVRRWIEQGAPHPADEPPAEDPRHFWSYLPVARHPVPAGAQPDWPLNAPDAFLSSVHAREGLAPRGAADRAILTRRVYLDLLGVPPSREQLHEHLADAAPDAWDRLLDRLLASPLYGQRWGRHWMDVWRYSDWYGSRGINEIRYSQRHIWRWRDWIVESLNADKPYDRMVVEMLAGDELEPGNPDVVRATGFLGRNWYKFDRNVWMFETVEQTCQAFMGLTMRCARCHDHKFDPISQRDYYHFRAIFEPHNVRTDPISANSATEKDATLGEVLREGVSLVFDKELEVPTYRFARGDSRNPEKDEALAPSVPAVLGAWSLDIQPVALPLAAFAPHHRPEIIESRREAARSAIQAAEAALVQQRELAATAQAKLAQFATAASQNATDESQAILARRQGTVLKEDFAAPRPEIWKVAGGEWVYENGHVTQKQPSTFPTLVSNVIHPLDFIARVRYRTLEAGSIHSVGLFFDARELRDCQAIYTATNNKTSSVQAFHRQDGTEQYPSAGIVPWPVQIGQEITLDLAARGPLLNVWVNGELAIVYHMPLARQSGTFAIWTHSGSASFHEVLIDPLPPEFPLANSTTEKRASPYSVPTRGDFEQLVRAAARGVELKELELTVARAEHSAFEARAAADLARIGESSDAADLARRAAVRERELVVAKAEVALHQAASAVESAQAAKLADEAAYKRNVDEAEKKREAAQKGLETARANLANEDSSYNALGPIYPRSSTGRRLALAKWLTDPRHPRTSRVAANQIWMRHFGEPLVATVANLGPSGTRPTHPELLDWLANELVDRQWSMKQFHRLLLSSRAYQMASSEGDLAQNLARDPTNRWLWRMNSRRAESEVVRDSVLFVSGRLDLSLGGPEIEESKGLDVPRRSLYFRSTPNEKMVMLELFDQANPNECYRRQESVVPQQALALINSSLALSESRRLAAALRADLSRDRADNRTEPAAASAAEFVRTAFETILSRQPTAMEEAACLRYLADATTPGNGKTPGEPALAEPFPAVSGTVLPSSADPDQRARENLILVLLNHNDFVTIR